MGTPESRLAAGLAKLGLALAPAQLEALAALAAELADWNTRVNLTAITAPDEVVDKHLLDSLAVLPLLKGRSVADVGSGAGFPGLPLAIADPDRRFTLIESTGKKVKFIRHVVEQLALPNVDGLAGAGGVLQAGAALRRGRWRGRSARSPSSCGWPGTWPGGGGRLLAMKGKVPEAEIAALPPGWKALAVHPVAVPGLDAERCVVELARV